MNEISDGLNCFRIPGPSQRELMPTKVMEEEGFLTTKQVISVPFNLAGFLDGGRSHHPG